MQFSCESCQATLHIGDDKVKGKRLVVRCKRCGARIHISDPALGPAPASAAPQATSAVLSPVAKAAPKSAPAPTPAREELRPVGQDDERDSDTEDTRAMESDVLEKALQASKRDDLTSGLASAKPGLKAAPKPGALRRSPAPEASPVLRDPPVWFAMVGGKQTGPMSRAEIALKTAINGISGRTYVWKEGMAGWLRGAEVPELASLFAPPPAKPAPAAAKPAPTATKTTPPPARPAPKPAPAAVKPEPKQLRDFSTEEFSNLKLEDDPGLAAKPGGDFSTQDFGALSLGGGEAISLSLNREPAPQRPGVAHETDADAPVSSAVKTTAPGRPALRPAVVAPPVAEPAHAQPAPDISAEGLAPVGQTEHDHEERTNVEALPLGERVHQEGVAQELFSSGEGGSVSAMDLAKWASSELGKRPASSPSIKRPGPPLLTPADQPPAATRASAPGARSGAPAAGAKPDPFAGVPDAPGLQLPNPADNTGKVLAKSGVHKSRAPLLLAVVGGVAVVILVLLWALLGGSDKPDAPVATETARPSLGGNRDASVGQLAGKPDAPATSPAPAPAPAAATAASGAKPAKAGKAAASAVDKAATEKQAEKLTQEQAEALKGLDNERGVGNHGPKVAAAETSAPEPAKAGTSLTPQDIRKKLVENKGALQSCIDDALRKEPDLRVGKIHIATNIAPSGQVTSTKIDKPKVDESPLGACLKRATKRIVFPAFDGDAFEVDIPIQVTAGE